MSEKKNEQNINEISPKDKLIVQKSRPLFSLWRSDLTLAEFKIIDTYLARINSNNPETKLVVFDKDDLERLLGVKRITNAELDKRLKNLMTTVKIENIFDQNEKKFTRIALFEKAIAEQDEYDQWKVKLMCTESAMEYIFNIENLGYLRYKLRCITSISSRYTYILFTYIEMNRYRKTWRVSVEELKEILRCENEDYCKEFKRFNDLVLKKIHKELHEKTECRYTYTPIKKGRSVVDIKFKIEEMKYDNDEIIGDTENVLDKNISIDLWKSALTKNDEKIEFTDKQLQEIWELLVTIPLNKMPNIYEDINLSRYHYIAQKYASLNRINEEEDIKNRFAYFVAMIKKDNVN